MQRVRKRVLYDHGAENFALRDTFKEAKETLAQFSSLDQSSGVNGNTAELFLQLIKHMQTFSVGQFQSLAYQITHTKTKYINIVFFSLEVICLFEFEFCCAFHA